MEDLKLAIVRGCFHALLLIGLSSAGLAQEPGQIRSLPMADARLNGPDDIPQGTLWIGWSADHRLGYIQGWLDGAYWEYFNACTQAQVAAPSIRDLQNKCLEHISAGKLSSEAYSTKVTEFYTKYPQDRALPIRRLLKKLLEPGMTTDTVHKWLDDLIESMHRPGSK